MQSNSNAKSVRKDFLSAARPAEAAAAREHCLELAAVINDTVIINDSMSTNIKKTCSSISSINAEIILLTGGRDRETDYSYLLDTDVSKLKAIVYLGEDSERLFHHFTTENILLVKAENTEEAIKLSLTLAKPGQVILYSPACPSYDVFDNYKNRGNKFRNLILALTNECAE